MTVYWVRFDVIQFGYVEKVKGRRYTKTLQLAPILLSYMAEQITWYEEERFS